MSALVRVYIASSRDGFIAGPGDDLSWLTGAGAANPGGPTDLIDDLTITLAPVALGAGHPLFAGMEKQYRLEVVGHHTYEGGMVQIRAKPRRG